MNASVLQENFVRALSRSCRILSVKAHLPILQNVLLKTADGQLQLVTSNLETTEIISLGAKVTAEGGICVSARLLTDFVMSLPPDTVHLSLIEGSLLVTCGKVKATIPGMSASEFPPVQTKKEGNQIHFEKDALIDALKRVLFCAATDEGRPLLTGLRLIGKNNELTLAATDGYRLSVKKLQTTLSDELDMVVPSRALFEVVKICQEEKDNKNIQFSKSEDGQLVVSVADTDIMTRLIDGEYPNYERIIPSSHTTRAVIPLSELSRAVKTAAIFAKDSANIIKFHLENNQLIVSSNTPSVGENSTTIDISMDGDGGDIAFNCRFLTEYLSIASGDEIAFEMTGALNPGVIRPTGDETTFYIVMPVRVTS